MLNRPSDKGFKVALKIADELDQKTRKSAKVLIVPVLHILQ